MIEGHSVPEERASQAAQVLLDRKKILSFRLTQHHSRADQHKTDLTIILPYRKQSGGNRFVSIQIKGDSFYAWCLFRHLRTCGKISSDIKLLSIFADEPLKSLVNRLERLIFTDQSESPAQDEPLWSQLNTSYSVFNSVWKMLERALEALQKEKSILGFTVVEEPDTRALGLPGRSLIIKTEEGISVIQTLATRQDKTLPDGAKLFLELDLSTVQNLKLLVLTTQSTFDSIKVQLLHLLHSKVTRSVATSDGVNNYFDKVVDELLLWQRAGWVLKFDYINWTQRTSAFFVFTLRLYDSRIITLRFDPVADLSFGSLDLGPTNTDFTIGYEWTNFQPSRVFMRQVLNRVITGTAATSLPKDRRGLAS